ncbi:MULTISPECIES: cell envelope biogenesis protein OmpA [Streptomyces]|uniref:cell envelope biogenesis protein OmpA n=1 Tax=Streptomyces TaxID=1883 RepID=UPI001D055D50|nr:MULTISPECIES: cell envelope biogenesis protein OmpA [Streptomyces]
MEHAGRVVFGAIDADRRRAAFVHRLCQICGEPLEERIYLLVRPMDVRAGVAPEPAVHPECLGYARQHCPMLNGDAPYYRRSPTIAGHPAGRPCDDPTCPCPDESTPADHDARAGAPADDWDAWMISPDHYRLQTGADGDILGLDLAVRVLRKRSIRRTPRREREEVLGLLRALLAPPPDDDQVP